MRMVTWCITHLLEQMETGLTMSSKYMMETKHIFAHKTLYGSAPQSFSYTQIFWIKGDCPTKRELNLIQCYLLVYCHYLNINALLEIQSLKPSNLRFGVSISCTTIQYRQYFPQSIVLILFKTAWVCNHILKQMTYDRGCTRLNWLLTNCRRAVSGAQNQGLIVPCGNRSLLEWVVG